MIKQVIFDIGNVLLYFQPIPFLSSFISDPIKAEEVFHELFSGEEWLMLDRGTLTEEEAKKIIMARSRKNADWIEKFYESWKDMLTPIEPTIEILKLLKQNGLRVYYLSNFHHLAFEKIMAEQDFFNCFDGGIVSYKVNLVKPEEAIFTRILDEYQLAPEETLFIDDTMLNVEAARKLHIQAIHLENPDELRDKLLAFGISF